MPISGYSQASILGQVTCSASLSPGAARSEPSGHLTTAVDRVHHGSGVVWRGAGGGMYPGWQGCRVEPKDAHYTRMDECIYGVY